MNTTHSIEHNVLPPNARAKLRKAWELAQGKSDFERRKIIDEAIDAVTLRHPEKFRQEGA